MKTYRVTCRGVKETFVVCIQGTSYGHEFGYNHNLLSFYKEKEQVAVFKEWLYFEVVG